MKFTATREAILPALETAARVAPARSTIPILGHALLTATAEGLAVRACDLDQETTLRLPAGEGLSIETPGAMAIPATFLRDAVKRLRDGARLTLAAADGAATIVAGRARFRVSTRPAADMPELAFDLAETARVTLPGAALAALLAPAQHAISTEETRYYLGGIYLHAREGRLAAVATDGHRLALSAPPDAPAVDDWPAIIVPKAAVAELLRLAQAAKAAPVVLEANRRALRATLSDGPVFVTKLIDGTFPDYQRVIPRDPPAVATLDRAALIEAITRVRLAQEKASDAIRLSVEPDAVAIAARASDGAEASDAIEIEDGRDFVAGFNGAYLAELAGTFDADRIAWAMHEPVTPALWTSPDHPGLLICLMPMRTP